MFTFGVAVTDSISTKVLLKKTGVPRLLLPAVSKFMLPLVVPDAESVTVKVFASVTEATLKTPSTAEPEV